MTDEKFHQARSFLARTVSKTRYSAREVRDLDFDIDTDYVMSVWLKQKGRCALTGWELEYERGGSWHGFKNPKGATMDRIDNSKGYVRGNVQLTCGLANLTRGKMTLKEFRELCKAVALNG